MLKKLIALFLAIPAVSFAAAEPVSVKLKITGEVYRQCTITPGQELTLDLGRHHVDKWSEGNSFMVSMVSEKYMNFVLEGCDPGTTIKISALATNPGQEYWWIANKSGAGYNPQLQAGVGFRKAGMTGGADFNTLYVNNTNPRTYKTTSAGTSQQNEAIELFAALRRTDNSVKPAGKFEGTVTIYFTFE